VDKQTILNIEEQLAQAKNNHYRIAIIEAFLLSRLRNDRIDQLATNAIQRIHSTNGIVKIKKLVEDFHISQDVFEKRFRRAVGASPKQYASIIRMNSIIKLKTNDQNLTDVAFSGEYFDQPHFNKEFKRFTGQTPTEFFKASSFW
jgi:AraC-like DNA-binding protein